MSQGRGGLRVALDAAFLGRQRGGDETWMRGLVAGLARRRRDGDEFPLLLADGVTVPEADDRAFPVRRVPSRPGPVHFARTLPAALRSMGRLDLAVTVTHAALGSSVPSVLVLGDLSFVHRPQDYPRATAARLRHLVPRQARRAAAVLVPSGYTRDDVVTTYGLDPEQVHVVPNRVAPAVRMSEDEARAELTGLGVSGPYLLYLGNRHPRKNLPRLIRAFRAARSADPALRDVRLVIAGATWFGAEDDENEAAGREDVLVVGRVDDRQRAALLSGADAVAYVSLFEGFGLPPLEAMAYGTPVLSSSVTSLPEVTGGAAHLVDPADDDAVAAGVLAVLTDRALRERLRAAGPAQAAAYDADRVGDAAVAAFHRAGSGDAISARRP